MNDLRVLNYIGVRAGKTTALCKAAKEIGATVIVHSIYEAKRLKKEYGVNAVSLDTDLRGSKGPYLVDTHAVAEYAVIMENRISNLEKALINERKHTEYWQAAWDKQNLELRKLITRKKSKK